MPAAPPNAAVSASARHTVDENKDSYPAGVAQLPREFPQRDRYRELAPQIPEARQIPRPASRALPIKFSGCLYPAYGDIHLRVSTPGAFKLRFFAYPYRIGSE